MESMFIDWLREKSVDIDAMIFRSPKDWCPDKYIFRFRYPNQEWSGHQVLTWNMDTFVKVRDIIKRSAP